MDEKKVTRLFAQDEITLSEYHKLLQEMGTRRNRDIISKKTNRSSMSSTKWT